MTHTRHSTFIPSERAQFRVILYSWLRSFSGGGPRAMTH